MTSVAFSPDGNSPLGSGGDRGRSRYRERVGRARVQARGGVTSVAFAGRYLAAVGSTTRPRPSSRSRASRSRTSSSARRRASVAFSPDGNSLAVGSARQDRVHLRDHSGSVAREFKRGGMVTSVAFSPDGNSLAVGSHDKTAAIIDIATAGASTRGDQVTSVAALAGRQSLAVARATRPRPSRDREWVGRARVRRRQVLSVAFSPDGNSLAVGSDDATAAIIDIAKGSVAREFGAAGWCSRSRRTATRSPWARRRDRGHHRYRERVGRARVQARRRRDLGRVLAGRQLLAVAPTKDRGHHEIASGWSRACSARRHGDLGRARRMVTRSPARRHDRARASPCSARCLRAHLPDLDIALNECRRFPPALTFFDAAPASRCSSARTNAQTRSLRGAAPAPARDGDLDERIFHMAIDRHDALAPSFS